MKKKKVVNFLSNIAFEISRGDTIESCYYLLGENWRKIVELSKFCMFQLNSEEDLKIKQVTAEFDFLIDESLNVSNEFILV